MKHFIFIVLITLVTISTSTAQSNAEIEANINRLMFLYHGFHNLDSVQTATLDKIKQNPAVYSPVLKEKLYKLISPESDSTQKSGLGYLLAMLDMCSPEEANKFNVAWFISLKDKDDWATNNERTGSLSNLGEKGHYDSAVVAICLVKMRTLSDSWTFPYLYYISRCAKGNQEVIAQVEQYRKEANTENTRKSYEYLLKSLKGIK
jgi:hypothetical protein